MFLTVSKISLFLAVFSFVFVCVAVKQHQKKAEFQIKADQTQIVGLHSQILCCIPPFPLLLLSCPRTPPTTEALEAVRHVIDSVWRRCCLNEFVGLDRRLLNGRSVDASGEQRRGNAELLASRCALLSRYRSPSYLCSGGCRPDFLPLRSDCCLKFALLFKVSPKEGEIVAQ